MIKISDYQIFNEHMCMLKDTSIDKRNGKDITYMTDSNKLVVNFDQVKEEYIKNLGLSNSPKSNDALFDAGKGNLIFVEFKNGYIDSKKQFDIRKKIYDSTLIFTDIVSIGISSMRKYTEYILVYNEDVNSKNPDIIKERKKHVQPSFSFDSFAKTVSDFAKQEYVCFEIKDIFENYCFKKVHTYTEEEFDQYLSKL